MVCSIPVAKARAGEAKAGMLELHLHRCQEPKYLNHPLLPSQEHLQELELEQAGLQLVPSQGMLML